MRSTAPRSHTPGSGAAIAGSLAERTKAAADHVDTDPTCFSWNRNAFADVARGVRHGEADRDVNVSTYRPFHRCWVETGLQLDASVSQLPRIFPDQETDNLAITSGNDSGKDQVGIYKIDGDTITICLARPGLADRPKEFKTNDENGHILVTIKRNKKDD